MSDKYHVKMRGRWKEGKATRSTMLEYIEWHWMEHGYAPSLRKICSACSLSISSAHYHLVILRAEGRVLYDDHTTGSIRPAGLHISFERPIK